MKKISVLYINAMGPRKETPHGGSFITKRIQALQDSGKVSVIPISLILNHTKFTKFILSLRGIRDQGIPLSQQMNISYDISTITYSFMETIFSRYFNARGYYKKSYKKLNQLLEKNPNAQIIHMHWIWPCGIGLPDVAEVHSIPYIVTCHGSDINVAMRSRTNRIEMLKILENAFCVEFVSQALLNTAKELGYSGKNAAIIYNGIDTTIFHGKRIAHPTPIVGYVGNLLPIKGADFLPKIFKHIFEMTKGNVKFVIAGDGILRKKLEEETDTLPTVFYGAVPQEQLADIYAEMDVLLLPSRAEGYGCVIKEAQACGVFPIGSDAGGISEAVGKYGATISQKDSEEEFTLEIAKAVVRYLANRQQIDLNSMIRHAMACSWQNRQEESIKIYAAALNNKNNFYAAEDERRYNI